MVWWWLGLGLGFYWLCCGLVVVLLALLDPEGFFREHFMVGAEVLGFVDFFGTFLF